MTAKHDKRVVSGRPGAGRFTAGERPEGLVELGAPVVVDVLRTLDFDELADDGASPLRAQLGTGVVYGIREAGSGEYRYIGQTSRGVNRRMYLHRFDSRKDAPVLPVHKWLRKHRGEEISVDILFELERDDVDALNSVEITLIAGLRARGDDLMNVSDGGSGTRGFKGTPEKNQAHAQRMTGEGNPRFGTTWSDETRAKILARQPSQVGELSPRYGTSNSPEHRRLLSENHHDVNGELNPFFGQKHTHDTRARMSATKAARSPEVLALASERMRAAQASRTPEERAAIGWRMSLGKHQKNHAAAGIVSKKCRICRGEPEPRST